MSVCLFVSVHWTDNWKKCMIHQIIPNINMLDALIYCKNIFNAYKSKMNQNLNKCLRHFQKYKWPSLTKNIAPQDNIYLTAVTK